VARNANRRVAGDRDAAPELFYPIVSATGTDNSAVCDALITALSLFRYRSPEPMRVINLLHAFSRWRKMPRGGPEEVRIEEHMDAGNEFRSLLGRGSQCHSWLKCGGAPTLSGRRRGPRPRLEMSLECHTKRAEGSVSTDATQPGFQVQQRRRQNRHLPFRPNLSYLSHGSYPPRQLGRCPAQNTSFPARGATQFQLTSALSLFRRGLDHGGFSRIQL
jgi:hypothetical protein